LKAEQAKQSKVRSKESELMERDKVQLKERLKEVELEAKKKQEQQEASRKAQEAAKQSKAKQSKAIPTESSTTRDHSCKISHQGEKGERQY